MRVTRLTEKPRPEEPEYLTVEDIEEGTVFTCRFVPDPRDDYSGGAIFLRMSYGITRLDEPSTWLRGGVNHSDVELFEFIFDEIIDNADDLKLYDVKILDVELVVHGVEGNE